NVKTRGYSVAPSPDNSASIRIMEDDAALVTVCEANEAGTDCLVSTPRSGSSVRSAVTSMPSEGQTLSFLVKMTYALEEDINVQVRIAETGNVLSGGGDRTIPIRRGEVVSGVFTVVTVDDSSDEDSSTVTVSVVEVAPASSGVPARDMVDVSSEPPIVFMVLDNDEPPLISFTREIYEGNEDDREVLFTVELLSVSPNSAGRKVSSEKEITFAYSTGDDLEADADVRADGGAEGTLTIDYVSVMERTLTIPANTRRITFTITTIDDEMEGEDETFIVSLLDSPAPVNAVVDVPAGLNLTGVKTATGRILDTILVDEANKVILPRLAMTIADETATAIGDRIRTAFGGGGDDGVTMRGSDWRQFIASQAAGNDEHAEAPELNLSDFAFAIAADTADRSGGWRDFGGGFLKDLSVWGRGYYRTLEVGEETDIEFDGGITGGMVGVDTMLKPNLLAGVSGNIFLSDLDFSSTSPSRTRTGTHETIAWSVHPYIGWNPTPRTTLWGTIGYGMGGIEVREDGRRSDSDTYFRERDIMLMTFGGGGSGELFNRRVGRGRVSVDAVGDMVFARIIEDGEEGLDADGGRVRLGLEMAATRPVWRGNVGGSIEMAYRGDFGDVLRGSGFEVAGGLKVGVPSIGLRIDGEARALMSHSDSVKERGFTGDITWSPGGGAQGPFVSFNPQWGATNDKSDALWNQGADGITADIGGGLRYELEFGYGAPLMYEMGDVKVFAGGLIEEGATVSRSGGLDIEMESGISAGYEAVDEVSAPGVEHRAYIKFIREF
ncbi:MAG: autotransporter domain-containing protein, partial [Candidatus Dadabacteria bacterium]|nr:autotransporter domain-containing protein [Candidatus Dadabacteria bacterium]